jgi:hypothetical protein
MRFYSRSLGFFPEGLKDFQGAAGPAAGRRPHQNLWFPALFQ